MNSSCSLSQVYSLGAFGWRPEGSFSRIETRTRTLTVEPYYSLEFSGRGGVVSTHTAILCGRGKTVCQPQKASVSSGSISAEPTMVESRKCETWSFVDLEKQ